MASGKPIISTIKTGYSIIKKYKCGVELENGTAKELSQAILEIYNMPQNEYEILCMNSLNGAKDFDFKILTRKLIKVIDTALEEYEYD